MNVDYLKAEKIVDEILKHLYKTPSLRQSFNQFDSDSMDMLEEELIELVLRT